ncbi:MAG: hypothetical protein L0H38_03455 [bacterium]|nr:hypothetical protein [bacterium]
MAKIKTKQLIYRIKHRYATTSNAVIVIAFVIAAGWAWGAVNVMQRNYELQREVSQKQRELQLVELQAQNLEYEKQYYKTNEYQSLAARDVLGLGDPGERVLIFSKNSPPPQDKSQPEEKPTTVLEKPSNLQQWGNFMFGGNSHSLQ